MTKEQIKKIEQSFRNGDDIVFSISGRVFIAEKCYKHRKEAMIEFRNCQEIDETCFEPNGDYYGDVLSEVKDIIVLDDPFPENPNMVASVYYEDEIRRMS